MADEISTCSCVSRKDALSLGLQFYFTGKPCKRGHIAQRRLINNGCVTCQKDNLQSWRDSNREHVRARDNVYRRRTSDRCNELERTRYAANPDKFRKKTRDGYRRNTEAIKAKQLARYYASSLSADFHKAAQTRTRKWAKENPERAQTNARLSRDRRRARKASAAGEYTYKDIAEIRKAQRNKCAYCRKSLKHGCHVDHIQPLARGGTNEKQNIQLLCPPCNLGKAARDPIDHARTLGLLV